MSIIQDKQYRKEGLALIFLAKKFVSYQPKDRIATIDDFCEESRMSRGTIQSALNKLREDKIITTVSRGHMGTVLVRKDFKKLIQFIDKEYVVGAMPLPYTKRYEGLGTALKKQFDECDIELSIAYVNGSLNRLRGLLANRYDFIIVSKLTSQYLCKTNKNVKAILELGSKTFLSKHVLVYRDGLDKHELVDGMKVGIDPNSYDYMLLTQQVMNKKNINFISIPYNQTLQMLDNKQIDVAIWNDDELIESKSSLYKEEIRSKDNNAASEAIVLIRKEDDFIGEILSYYININKIIDIQGKILNGEMWPEY